MASYPLVRQHWALCARRLLGSAAANSATAAPVSDDGRGSTQAAGGASEKGELTASTPAPTPAPAPDADADADASAVAAAMYDRYVASRYGREAQRAYHTLEHLECMFDFLRRHDAHVRRHGHPCEAATEAPVPREDANDDTSSSSSSSSDGGSRLSTAAAAATVPPCRGAWEELVLSLSVLFHDAVYDPARADNEELSADLADECLAECRRYYYCHCEAAAVAAGTCTHTDADTTAGVLWEQPPAVVEAVTAATRAYILATKRHLAVPPYSLPPPLAAAEGPRGETLTGSSGGGGSKTPPAAPGEGGTPKSQHDAEEQYPLRLVTSAARARYEMCLFLDLDLAVLGLPRERYMRYYAAGVRHEYTYGGLYSPAAFAAGRSAFLQSFLRNHYQSVGVDDTRPSRQALVEQKEGEAAAASQESAARALVVWYKTPYFQRTLEERAVANVRAELESLAASAANL